MTTHVWPVRVYYEDTDAGGVVYYANYLKFLERARTEWLRELGFEQDALMNQGIIFAVRKVCIDYLMPARFNQLLEVQTMVTSLGTASIEVRQQLFYEQSHLAEAQIKLACIDAASFRPRKLPETIIQSIKGSINVS